MGASIWKLLYEATINTVHATVNIWEPLYVSLYMEASIWDLLYELLYENFDMGQQSTQRTQQSTYGSLYMGACIWERLYGSFYMGASIWELLYGATINTMQATVNIWELLYSGTRNRHWRGPCPQGVSSAVGSGARARTAEREHPSSTLAGCLAGWRAP